MDEQTKNGCQCENAGCGCDEVRADSCACGDDCNCSQVCGCDRGCSCPASQSA
jgi:hypothetical protein